MDAMEMAYIQMIIDKETFYLYFSKCVVLNNYGETFGASDRQRWPTSEREVDE